MSAKRKLRRYKDWVFDPSANVFRHKKHGFEFVGAVNVCHFDVDFTDDDHAALMDLKAYPYEQMPTLEKVVWTWWQSNMPSAYILNSDDLCDTIRAAFPHIDTRPETDA